MKIPYWLPLLLFVGYSYWAVNYWHCHVCQCCPGFEPPPPPKSTGVPKFKWNADQPVADSVFADWKKILLAKGGQGDTLLITGLYRSGEAFKGKLANLGLARAASLAAMMEPEFPASRIKTAAKTVSDDLADGGDARESAEFSWSKMMLKKEQSAVIVQDNAATFLFPFNSSARESDPKVDAYLQALIEKHKATANTFTIVGHTDAIGSAEENQALGLARANAIRQILEKGGIAAARIQASSKGATEPVSDNSTEDGRHRNRRVVLTVNK